MKSLLILATVAFSASAFSSEALIKFTRGSGFAPIPYSSVLSVYETGKVEVVVTRGVKTTKTQLEDLSPNTIQEIKDNIDAVKAQDAIVDLDANKPRCMDAPSSRILITKNKKEVMIASFASCHRNQMQSKAATALIKKTLEIDSKRK